MLIMVLVLWIILGQTIFLSYTLLLNCFIQAFRLCKYMHCPTAWTLRRCKRFWSSQICICAEDELGDIGTVRIDSQNQKDKLEPELKNSKLESNTQNEKLEVEPESQKLELKSLAEKAPIMQETEKTVRRRGRPSKKNVTKQAGSPKKGAAQSSAKSLAVKETSKAISKARPARSVATRATATGDDQTVNSKKQAQQISRMVKSSKRPATAGALVSAY